MARSQETTEDSMSWTVKLQIAETITIQLLHEVAIRL